MAPVTPSFEQPFPVFQREDIPGRVRAGETSRGLQWNVEHMPQKCAHHTAVRDGHDRLAKVSRGQFVKAGDNAVQLLTRAFAARNDVVRPPGFQEPVFVRKILLNPGDE